MPLKRYGVLKGRPVERRLATGQNGHYQVRIVDDTTDYRIAINVSSKLSPSELEYLVNDHFVHPITDGLEDLPLGFHALPKRTPNGGGLDFIRGNLLNRDDMHPLPFDVPGQDNDLNEKLDGVVQRAMGDETALVYAFGERWGPEDNKKDKYFGFLPGNGIHDIHMNQGNHPNFKGDDGVWQDGGLLVQLPEQNQWLAVFLKFQSQTWHTHDTTGHALGEGGRGEGEPPTTEEPDGLVRIVGALVNDIASPEVETVTLLNTSPGTIDLAGWHLADKNKNRHPLSGEVKAGEAQKVVVRVPMQLSNKGGIITLLNEEGLKVHGVSYTKSQAQNPGWTIVF